MDKPIRKADVRSNSFESFARAKQAHQPILRNRRASISSYPERVRSSSICLSDDSWVYSPQQKVEWVDETKVNDCRGCHKPFSMIVRKHHCRNCGDVFCGACSSFKILLPNFNERQRVCAICITLLASDAPPRSPDAPGYPSELAVNTSLPDDLDDLFEEIIGNNEDFQQDPVVRPRRSVSSVSRPPRKLFSAGLPLPSSEDDESCTEQTTTITFGTDSFNKTLCALATISENQLNAGRDGTDSTDGDEPARKKSFSSLRPPRKSFSSSSPLKKSSLIMANGIENIQPNLNEVAVFHAENTTISNFPAAIPSPSKDFFHSMSPIAHLSPESSRKDHYCETIEAFTPAAKTVTDAPFLAPVASESKINSPLVKQVMNLSPKASPLQVVDMVQLKSAEVAVAGSVVVQTPKLTNRNFIIAISLLTLLLIGPIFFFFTTSNSTIKDFKRVELKSARSYDLETAVIPAPKSADCANGISAAKKLQTEMSRQLNKGQNLFNFGMYDDIMEISDVEIPVSSRSGEDRQSFGPRVSGASAMTVFKRRTYQIFSDSIQSHTVNNFVKMLRELYRRIKELNLLKRFDHFIRGVVLSMVNSGQERIPAQI